MSTKSVKKTALLKMIENDKKIVNDDLLNDIGNKVRPEKIQVYLIEHIENCISEIEKAGLKVDKQEEIFKPIVKAVFDFHDNYYRLINENNAVFDKGHDEGDSKFSTDKITTEGLGFGLITSSPANAALFSIMDAHERNKQYNRQYDRMMDSAQSTAEYYQKDLIKTLYPAVMDLYEKKFKTNILSAVDETYILLNSLAKN